MSSGILSRSPAVRARHLQAWAVSLFVHGLACAAAVTLSASVHLAPQPEPFRWTVSLIEGPTGPSQPPLGAPATDLSQVPPSALASANPVTNRQVEQRPPVSRPAPSVIQDPAPVQRPVPMTQQPAVTRVIPQDTAEPREKDAATQTASPVLQQAVIQRPAQTLAQPESAPATPSIVERTLVSKTPPVLQSARTGEPQTTPVEESRTVVEAPPVELTRRTQMEPTPVTRPPVVETPRPVSKPILQDIASVPRSAVSEPIQTPSAMDAPDEPAEPEPVSARAPVASLPALGVGRSSAKPDYGWLADALWKRIEKLKQYPQHARLNRLEGRVVLRVVIGDDGSLLDLAIAKSSGHAVLDQDALEVLRRAAPLTLLRPLGKSQVVVKVPISYRLDR